MTRKEDQLDDLRHSVAFRVSEKEWRLLQKAAGEKQTTVPQLAKQLLFERMGWRVPVRGKREYGQVAGGHR